MAEPDLSSWRIEIANGPNAGAIVPLAAGRYRVGFDPGNDIVLADQAIAAEQATLEIGPNGVFLTALAAGAALKCRSFALRSLAAGTSSAIRPGSEIRVGSTVLRFNGPQRLRFASIRFTCLAAAFLVACSTMAGYLFATPHEARATARAAGADASPSATSLAAAAAALRQHLRADALAGSIAIAESRGALLASGTIAPDQASDWNRAQQWFDAGLGRQFTLLDRVRAKPSGAPDFALAAVSTFPIPYAIDRDGARYTEGAVLDGGWVIAHITTHAVTLSRDGQTIRMTL
jgi:hypothetical protein